MASLDCALCNEFVWKGGVPVNDLVICTRCAAAIVEFQPAQAMSEYDKGFEDGFDAGFEARVMDRFEADLRRARERRKATARISEKVSA